MALNTKIRGNQVADAFFGAGLKRNGSDVNIAEVNVDGSSIEINSDALRIKALGVTNDMLAGSIADGKLAEDYVQTDEFDNSTLEWSGTVAQIKNLGVTTAKIANDAVDNTKLDLTKTYDFGAEGGDVKVATTPATATSAVNKSYVDGVAQGLDIKDSVRLIGTFADGNITLSGISGQTLDGIQVVADDRVLLVYQTDAKENGIWVVKSGAWVRPADFATGATVASAYCFVQAGNTLADTGWVCTSNSGSDVVGTDNLAFTQFTGTGTITAGSALSKDGNTLNVNVDNSTIEVNGSDQLQVKNLGITTGKIANDAVDKTKINSDVAGNGILQNVDGSLELNPDNSSIEIASGEVLRVKALGITNAMLAGSIADTKLAEDYVKTSEVDNSTIEFTSSALKVKDLGIVNGKIAENTIQESKLAIYNSPTTGKVLGYTSNGLEWVSGTDDAVIEGDIQLENKSASCNGSQTTFTLANAPLANSIQVFLNGLLQEKGSGKDYTVSGSDVIFAQAPLTDDILLIHYIINN